MMKKLLFILILVFPNLLIAQQDNNPKPLILEKLEICDVIIAGKYHNKDTVLLSELYTELQKTAFLKTDCGEFIGCAIYFGRNGSYSTTCIYGRLDFNNAFLLPSSHPNYSTVIILNIKYKTSDGVIHTTKGVTLTVKTK